MKQTAKDKNFLPIPWLTVSLSLSTLLLYLLLGAAPESLVYDRYTIARGELWRLFSGHFVHCDPAHLAWNLAALFLLGGLLEKRLGSRLLGVIATSCLGVSGWLWFVKTNLQFYCGLSGMLNGLLAVLLVTLWRESRQPFLLLIGIGALLKVVVEATYGQPLFTHINWASVPGAHGAGIVAGLLYLFTESVPAGRFSRTRS